VYIEIIYIPARIHESQASKCLLKLRIHVCIYAYTYIDVHIQICVCCYAYFESQHVGNYQQVMAKYCVAFKTMETMGEKLSAKTTMGELIGKLVIYLYTYIYVYI